MRLLPIGLNLLLILPPTVTEAAVIDNLPIAVGVNNLAWGQNLETVLAETGDPVGVVSPKVGVMVLIYGPQKALRFTEGRLAGATCGPVVDWTGPEDLSAKVQDKNLGGGLRLGLTYKELNAILPGALPAKPAMTMEVKGKTVTLLFRFTRRGSGDKAEDYTLYSVDISALELPPVAPRAVASQDGFAMDGIYGL